MRPLDGLFPQYQLLSWLPDETFFSLVSRHHFLWGHTTAAKTCELIFGRPRAGTHHDFPNSLQAFVDRVGEAAGDVQTIAREHTLLKYYQAFLGANAVDDVISSMAGPAVSHLKLRLGILTSRFRSNHPLKACPSCMAQDAQTYGWAYWHLQHQYPGVWVCASHRVPLLQSSLKATGVQRFQWLLPNGGELQSVPMDDAHSFDALMSLATLVQDIVSQGAEQPLFVARLHEVYRHELQRRSWITPAGQLRSAEIAGAFFQYAELLRRVPEFSGLPKDAAEASTQLSRLLRPPRTGTHPLRHLMLIHWLFGTAATFNEACEHALKSAELPRLEGAPGLSIEDEDPRRDHLSRLICEEGLSVRQAAREIGIDTQTAMVWAGSMGLHLSRRPKKLSPMVRAQAVRQLRRGADKADVAAAAGVSVETVTRVLLGEPGLHAAWSAARESKVRARARAAWLTQLEVNGALGLKWIREMAPGVYAWLYRNDRAWLNTHKPASIPPSKRKRVSPVDWSARDQALSALVRETALQLMTEQGLRRVRFWQLYQAIPELKAKMNSLDALPMTRQAIELALKATPPASDSFI